MNSDIEKAVIEGFVIKRKADRIIYELNSPKKRRECIWKMNSDIFADKYCRKLSASECSCVKELLSTLKSYGSTESCYIFSIDEQIDRKTLPLEEALKSVFCQGPALISIVHGKLAYFEAEHEHGASERFILLK
ncbi:MAG: hypothetical protein E7546_06770 [Ruminococcaceae bacterium]|nr:hypothetical protein [Oscillospiraceae bacterium]